MIPGIRTRLPQLRLALLAVATGLFAGAGAGLFRVLIAVFHNLFFLGILSFHYDANMHTPASPWGVGVLLVPVLGALLVTYLVSHYAPEAKGHGVPEVIDAIHYHSGVIRPTVALVKALASALSIGSGGAVGREGPIIQIGAAFGSTVGQLIRMPIWQRLTLIACGAGGGIAATFNTPIGGLLFAIELILPEISSRTLIPVALATGAATAVGRLLFGDAPAFSVPPLALHTVGGMNAASLVLWPIFGVLLGLVSALYIRALYAAEDAFEALPGNAYSRHALGMFLVGLMMFLLLRNTGHYYIQGVGYATVQDILQATLSNPGFLLLLFALKLLATCLTLGSGASGGIFSPSLFMGATLGAGYALLSAPLIAHPLNVAGAAVIGMAGMVAGTTGAVVTAIVMIFEMTRDYGVVIPLMVTATLAYGVRRVLVRDSIYTLKLTRRGHAIPEALQTNLYLMHSAADLIGPPLLRRPADDETPVGRLLLGQRQPPFVLLTRDEQVTGLITDATLRRSHPGTHLNALPVVAAGDCVQVVADDSLFDIFTRLRNARADYALVTDKESNRVRGVLSWEAIADASNLPVSLRRRKSASE